MTSSAKHDERLHLGGYFKLAGVKVGGGLLRRDNDGDAVKPRSNLWYVGASYPVTEALVLDRKSTRLNSSHSQISYAVFCLKKKKKKQKITTDAIYSAV